MKYIVQGNYSKFRVTLTQKSGELIQPYIPTATDEVKISLRGARVYEYKEYEQAENVLTFSDNGCLRVGIYELEVRIIDNEQHRLRCMYREQLRVVASNDDVPTDASFDDDDVQLNGQFDIVASTEIVVDDELSLTSTNPVQNKVVTQKLKTKYDEYEIVIEPNAIDLYFLADGEYVANLYIDSATSTAAGVMSAADKSKLDALPTNSDLQTALNAKGGTLAGDMTAAGYEIDLKSGNTSLSQVYVPFATAQADGLMSASDYTKLAALPTDAELTTALNGKQDTLTWDTEPTQNSTNPVTSGGLYNVLGDIESVLDNILGN